MRKEKRKSEEREKRKEKKEKRGKKEKRKQILIHTDKDTDRQTDGQIDTNHKLIWDTIMNNKSNSIEPIWNSIQ